MIERKLIPNSQRLAFLPKKIPKYYLRFEHAVYGFMGHFAEGYKGGFWNFYELSNGGFYMALDDKNKIAITNPDNYFSGSMAPDAASIGVNLFALNTVVAASELEAHADAYYALRDYATQHKERESILAFID